MRVLVTGSAGMLGFALAESCPPDVTFVEADLPGTDITDAASVARALRESGAEAVINAAAYTNVDGCEAHEAEALAVNGTGAGHVAAACAAAGIPLLHVSTDYVFDGTIPAPGEYAEEDRTDPLSAYGRTKLAGEQLVRENSVRHWIVRTQWLYGSHGKNFVDTMLALAATRPDLAVVDDQVGSPTSTHDLAPILWLFLRARPPHGTYHASNAGSCSWHDFAAEIFRRGGVRTNLGRQSTAQLGRPAPRPVRSVLNNAKLRDALGVALPPWDAGLQRYLDRRTRQGANA